VVWHNVGGQYNYVPESLLGAYFSSETLVLNKSLTYLLLKAKNIDPRQRIDRFSAHYVT